MYTVCLSVCLCACVSPELSLCLCLSVFVFVVNIFVGAIPDFYFLDTLPLLKVERTFSCRTLLEVVLLFLLHLFSDIGRCELFDSFSLVYFLPAKLHYKNPFIKLFTVFSVFVIVMHSCQRPIPDNDDSYNIMWKAG